MDIGRGVRGAFLTASVGTGHRCGNPKMTKMKKNTTMPNTSGKKHCSSIILINFH